MADQLTEPQMWDGQDLTADDFVTVSRAEYDELKRGALLLGALQAAGVDNWHGFDHAVELFNKVIDLD